MSGESLFKDAVDLAQFKRQAEAKARQAAAASGQVGDDDFTKSLDMLDSEILEIERVYDIIRARSRGSINYQHFQDEIKDRFADIGWVVDVVWYETNLAGVKMPEIVFKRRVERKVFDRDQMVHEVTSDILGLGTGGVIKTDQGKVAALIDGSYRGQEHDHKH